jgi:hypothetical protein
MLIPVMEITQELVDRNTWQGKSSLDFVQPQLILSRSSAPGHRCIDVVGDFPLMHRFPMLPTATWTYPV